MSASIKLTGKQIRFAQLVAAGHSSFEAYKQAYQPKNPGNISTLAPIASKMLKNAKIVDYIDELRKPVARKVGIDLESHLAKLEEIRDLALENGNYAAAVSAEVNRGKAVGIYIDRHDSTIRTLNANVTVSPDQLKDVAARLLTKI